ncbi:hypothetical protein VSH64_06635 [Amycolatopsis rhabdoformis]|uniref:DUF6745 domain-containing protein n=1 Tax=Amycolatopsis rhabdoformis TaxID=1448059 RepID=A0ABZ1IBJ5_9PSEU|nr:hypothetical protein [Amycolatopsis rhabdoformis]WSE31782.1 hypothetical protein VSH64_06635 [Amycolatopsis rhabdoformis]
MTAPGGPGARVLDDPELADFSRARWQLAEAARAEWLGHALSCEPADRPAAEAAISGLYALEGEPPPEFVWVDSPAAAAKLVPPDPVLSLGSLTRLENRMAGSLSELRTRLNHRIAFDPGPTYFEPPLPGILGELEDPGSPRDQEAALTALLTLGVRGALQHSIRDSVTATIKAELREPVGLGWYGQHEAHWLAHYDAHRRLGVHFGRESERQLDLWAETVRSCGWWWPREGVCVVTERPVVVRTEPLPGSAYGELRVHNADGPAIAYPDGWRAYAWHGTPVPAWVIEDVTTDAINTERNIEVRRCAVERLGWDGYLERAGLTFVARAPDPGNRDSELLLYDIPRAPGTIARRLLLAVNGSVERDGTRRRYGLSVPPWFDDPVDAAGWSYGLTGAQYAGLLRRT